MKNFILDYEFVPEAIELFFRKQAVMGDNEIRSLPIDKILDIEFFSPGDRESIVMRKYGVL